MIKAMRTIEAVVPALEIAVAGVPFGLKLGDKEVMAVWSMYYWAILGLAAGASQVWMGLWRKTDSNPETADWTRKSDFLWDRICSHHFITESLEADDSEQVGFDPPLVLIRAPRLVARRSTAASGTVKMRLYYTIEKVTDEELARLMVKDHA